MQPLQYDFLTPSCKRQWYYAASRSSQDPWCSHYSAICRDRLAKHNRTTRTVPEIEAPKPEPDAKAKKERFWSIKKKKHQHQNWENLVPDHYRNLHAAAPIRFTTPSCKRQWYYAASRSSQDPWCSHYSAICRDWLAKHNRTMRTVPEIEAPKPDPGAKAKKDDFERHFLEWILKGKSPAPELWKSICWPLQCGLLRALAEPSPQPPHTPAALHRRLQPLYTKKRNVLRSGFLPNTSPLQHPCSQHTAFCNITWLTRMYLRTWQQNMTTFM